ncbi:MAG: cytochrome-c peroxidase [Chitinophagales bacterium]|nr:cytochrome-c peroxidase [Chitinophagales bacterium]MDW8417886.1 cytochrome c peroxidase [Chitinophagales bacterium]
MKNSPAQFSKPAFLFVLFAALLVSCRKEKNIKEEIRFEIPANFPAPKYNFSSNPVTTAGFELGRKLFYEPQLSRDNTISCGSCHISFSAFTHHGHAVSHGIDNRLGIRNAPPVMNTAWSDEFMWDGGINQLDMLPIAPIENPVEMDLEFAIAVQKIKNNPAYPPLFKAAFGTEEITGPRLLQALSQFMNMLVSANAKYDKWKRGEDNVQLTADELDGYHLVQQKCASCHSTDLFTDNKFHNNGIRSTFTIDSGRAHITQLPQDVGKFKTPSLRNLKYTAPYMHDGSFATLEQVLDHYAQGVKYSPTLDAELQKNGILGIPLTAIEKQKIIAFLNTLNDEKFVKDRRFAEQ